MAGKEADWEDGCDDDDGDVPFQPSWEEKWRPSHKPVPEGRSGSDGSTVQWRKGPWKHSWNERIFPSWVSSFESIFEILDCGSWIP